MPEFVYDIPTNMLASYFAIIAVGSVIFGILIVKPLLRLLMGSGPDLNESINYGTSAFSLFYGLLLGLLTVAAYQNSERAGHPMETFGSDSYVNGWGQASGPVTVIGLEDNGLRPGPRRNQCTGTGRNS